MYELKISCKSLYGNGKWLNNLVRRGRELRTITDNGYWTWYGIANSQHFSMKCYYFLCYSFNKINIILITFHQSTSDTPLITITHFTWHMYDTGIAIFLNLSLVFKYMIAKVLFLSIKNEYVCVVFLLLFLGNVWQHSSIWFKWVIRHIIHNTFQPYQPTA